MIIENPEAFKSWLTSILEPLCDADPAALAKYVYALVKKDKPLEELRDGMLDQLDVFLQQETKPFVDMLFKALETNEYLKLMEKMPSPAPEKEPENEGEAENHVPGASNGASPPLAGVPRARSPHPALAPARHRVVVCRTAKVPPPPPPPPLREHTLVKVLPLTELLEEPVDQPPRRRDRRENMREERRRRRSRSWERRARARRHTRDGERDPDMRRRPLSRSPSPRGRFRNRSPPPAVPDRPNTRSRSRSPVPHREHERERDRLRPLRELERDRASRDRERQRSRERSRDRSHSGSPPPRAPEHYKRRCRDFDEKGYCMRGDLCQWDHGTDPVVLEDAALTSVLTMPAVPEYNPLTPDIWCGVGYPPYPPPRPHPPLPPRELIPIPRIHEAAPPTGAAPNMGAPRPPAPPKKNFDYNRLGRSGPPRPPASSGGGNCSLEVKKVPRGLNDITHLNNHFGKFGKIVNIQVCFEGDPEGALITFSNHTEANVAYKSTEAVLNNRFIKVFWHNPENKQENMAPSGQQKPTNSQQPTSHNKVLINRENIKATADTKLALAAEKAKEIANGTENKKEAPKPLEKSKQVMEMHKRAQALLETQLQQQVLLIQRLEGGNVTGAQKVALMEAINSAQEGIEKLRKELVAYTRQLKQMQEETVARSMSRLQLAQANAKRPKTREEAQKEILDAELDMFTKQQEGQDVTELAKRISELRRQMAMQFPVHPAMRRPHSRGGRFSTSNRFTRAPQFVNQSVDHRPRALLVSGFESDESQALEAHFAQFGEIVSKELNPTVPELVVAYKLRAHAELAAQQGKHYNDRTLTITWVANAKAFTGVARPASPQVADAAEPAKDPETPQEAADALLRFDEEDEDEEDRSWRR